MKGMNVKVFKVPMKGPEDVSGIKKLVMRGKIKAKNIVAIIGKTEGNGLVNDFSRGFAAFVCKMLISQELNIPIEAAEKRVSLVMSGGTEGVLSPHFTVFAREKVEIDSPRVEKRLVIGISRTRDFLPEEIGTIVQIKEVAKMVEQAIKDAYITHKSDVHFVQIKCPLLTSDRIEEAHGRGKKVVAEDPLKSMAYSRGASALGVALALGEVDEACLSDEVICKDWNLYSKVASTSAGVELMNCEIIVMGNSTRSVSDLVIGHGVMKDSIDVGALKKALKSAGLKFECCPADDQLKKVINVFAKAEADPSGEIRGRRHTMLTDSMLPSTRHARAVVGALIASTIGDPMVYVSGGAEHQGHSGGGPIAVIRKLSIQ
ncbi:MAG: ring-opening amidohydrolase [Actinomycetota bacterium]|nr:ring-opening amidohydrolase [Actinomycetota bacterium]